MRSNRPDAQEMQRRIISISLLGAPGSILLGLALYGIFAGGDAFWEPLNDTAVTYNMLGIGAIIMAWESVQMVKLARLKRHTSGE